MTAESPDIEDSSLIEELRRALADGFVLEFYEGDRLITQMRGEAPSNGLKLLVRATPEPDGYEKITLKPQLLPLGDLQAIAKANAKRQRKARHIRSQG